MDRPKRPISARFLCQMLAVVVWFCCTFWLAWASANLRRQLWTIGDPDVVRVERFSFYLAVAIFSVLGFLVAWKIPARLGLLLRRAWSFYRTGQCGVEEIISRFVTGDTLGRLRIARQFFRLESRVTFTSPRPWVVHCPMCQKILIGYPTDRARCPNCSQGITYLQLAMHFNAEVPNARFAGEPAFGWVPGRVGEYLKKRYGSIWR